jgi:hypothetical protein
VGAITSIVRAITSIVRAITCLELFLKSMICLWLNSSLSVDSFTLKLGYVRQLYLAWLDLRIDLQVKRLLVRCQNWIWLHSAWTQKHFWPQLIRKKSDFKTNEIYCYFIFYLN